MRLVFLGTGGAGTPPIGVGRHANRSTTRTSNALIIQPNHPDPPTILLDAGANIRVQWTAWADAPLQPDAVILSHEHHDHILGMGEFRRCPTPVPVYGTARTLEHLALFGKTMFPHDPALNLAPHELPEHGEATVAGVAIRTMPLHHNSPLTGFVIPHNNKVVAHLTDTGPVVDAAVRVAIAGCDVLIVNTPFMHDTPIPGVHPSLANAHEAHVSIPQAITLAEEVGAKRLVLLHFLYTVSSAELAEVVDRHPWVTIASDGMVLNV